jgi:hypothetical protein
VRGDEACQEACEEGRKSRLILGSKQLAPAILRCHPQSFRHQDYPSLTVFIIDQALLCSRAIKTCLWGFFCPMAA